MGLAIIKMAGSVSFRRKEQTLLAPPRRRAGAEGRRQASAAPLRTAPVRRARNAAARSRPAEPARRRRRFLAARGGTGEAEVRPPRRPGAASRRHGAASRRRRRPWRDETRAPSWVRGGGLRGGPLAAEPWREGLPRRQTGQRCSGRGRPPRQRAGKCRWAPGRVRRRLPPGLPPARPPARLPGSPPPPAEPPRCVRARPLQNRAFLKSRNRFAIPLDPLAYTPDISFGLSSTGRPVGGLFCLWCSG